MFSYLSLLIERGHFDEIHMNHLIVGHTHTSIDQYFSVITKKLYGKFVGSPFALQNLFNQCEMPQINRMILVHYNYYKWLEPVINKNIHHYGLPHCFQFKRRLGKAVCQHKPYSRSPKWFPVEPTHIPSDQAELEKLSCPLVNEELAFLGGIDIINESLGFAENIKTNILSGDKDRDLFQRILLLKDLMQPLKDIEARTSCEITNRNELQSRIGYLNTLTDRELSKKVPIPPEVTNEEQLLDEDEIPIAEGVFEVDSGDEDEVQIVESTPSLPALASLQQLVPMPVTKDQLTAFSSALAKFNYEDCGYLLWLDYSKAGEEWFNSVPSVFDYSSEVS